MYYFILYIPALAFALILAFNGNKPLALIVCTVLMFILIVSWLINELPGTAATYNLHRAKRHHARYVRIRSNLEQPRPGEEWLRTTQTYLFMKEIRMIYVEHGFKELGQSIWGKYLYKHPYAYIPDEIITSDTPTSGETVHEGPPPLEKIIYLTDENQGVKAPTPERGGSKKKKARKPGDEKKRYIPLEVKNN